MEDGAFARAGKKIGMNARAGQQSHAECNHRIDFGPIFWADVKF